MRSVGTTIVLKRNVEMFMTDEPTPLMSIPHGTQLTISKIATGFPAPYICVHQGVEVYIAEDDIA